jgi:hypothetical protein
LLHNLSIDKREHIFLEAHRSAVDPNAVGGEINSKDNNENKEDLKLHASLVPLEPLLNLFK